MNRATIATLAAAALSATGAAAKEGFHIARPTLVAYDDRGRVTLALEPTPSADGFRCAIARFDATETRRYRMLEVAMAHAPHLPMMSIYLEDVAGSDTCRATIIARSPIGRAPVRDATIYPAVDDLTGTPLEPLERLIRDRADGLTPPENGD